MLKLQELHTRSGNAAEKNLLWEDDSINRKDLQAETAQKKQK